jgi:hypothetical protein
LIANVKIVINQYIDLTCERDFERNIDKLYRQVDPSF